MDRAKRNRELNGGIMVSINNSINNTVGASNAGEVNTLLVHNPSDTANSAALVDIKIGGTSADYAQWRLGVENTGSFSGAINAAGTQYSFQYTDDDDVVPTDTQIFRIDSINVATGESRLVKQSEIAIAEEGTGLCRLVMNTNNAAGVNALIQMIQHNGTNDALIQYEMGGNNWFHGVDASASNSWFLTQGIVGGWPPSPTNTIIQATTAGEVTFPLTPAFLAFLGTDDLNATGAGTLFTLGSGNALTEVFDQNNDFNVNGTFTAPITGRYQFHATITVSNITGAMTFGQINIVTSNRTYQGNNWNAAAVRTVAVASNNNSYVISILADMDAGDTANVTIQLAGGAGDTARINGAGTNTFFSGMLSA